MRRAVLVLAGTVAGLAVLFSFKAHSLAAAAPTPAPTSPAPAPVATHVFTGPETATRYGLMQVKVTMVGQRVTQVTVVRRTGAGATQRIASLPIPKT